MTNIVVIGLGGIGGCILPLMWKAFNNENTHLILIDGDSFELRNITRQFFNNYGPKATEWKNFLQGQTFNKCRITAVNAYFPTELYELQEGDIVVIGVDNHFARKIINEKCKQLNNVIVISGGNELIDGNAQFYIRKNGELMAGEYLDTLHPEIGTAKKEEKKTTSCDRAEDPQYLATNNFVATIMFNILFNILNGAIPDYTEVCIDILSNKALTNAPENVL